MVKRYLWQVGLILAVTSIIALSYNTFSSSGISLLAEPLIIESGADITLEQAYRLYKSGDVVFIDSRSSTSFKRGHITNAINISTRMRMDEIKNTLSAFPENQMFVAYCSGSSCSSSRRLAQKIRQLGYPKVYVFYGGWFEWKRSKFPIDGTKNLTNENNNDTYYE